jgi:DNA invertase Pin-like site-specific DNA recombinase
MTKKRKPLALQPGWAIYLRTSSKETQHPKLSQDRQRFGIRNELLNFSELPIIGEYVDTDTGRNIERTNYQRLLRDARLGKFSHVAVENAERFGRKDTEALRAIDELDELGIKIRFADYPRLDPIDADDRIIIVYLFGAARRESMKIGERAQGGIHTKLRAGGYTGRAPDGYLNCREQVVGLERELSGRTRNWIEADPKQFPVWREAWRLLLTEQYTLEQICEALHAQGATLRSGLPFVKPGEKGKRTHATNALSAAFHNWAYAGWVVSKVAKIGPKETRGNWEPVVTTEEFEQGLAILEQRNQKRHPNRKHFYLLKRIAYVEINGKIQRLSGSTSNIHRTTGGNRYYCLPRSDINLPCDLLDEQVWEGLQGLEIDPDLHECLKNLYCQEVAAHAPKHESTLQELQAALADIDDKERRMLRRYRDGKVTESIWDEVWAEVNHQRQAIQQQVSLLGATQATTLNDLDDGVAILHQLPTLYGKLPQDEQQLMLNLLIQRVVVDRSGTLLRIELHPPFAYLISRKRIVEQWQTVNNQNATLKKGGTFRSSCSEYVQESWDVRIRNTGSLPYNTLPGSQTFVSRVAGRDGYWYASLEAATAAGITVSSRALDIQAVNPRQTVNLTLTAFTPVGSVDAIAWLLDPYASAGRAESGGIVGGNTAIWLNRIDPHGCNGNVDDLDELDMPTPFRTPPTSTPSVTPYIPPYAGATRPAR